jgi:predicted porin
MCLVFCVRSKATLSLVAGIVFIAGTGLVSAQNLARSSITLYGLVDTGLAYQMNKSGDDPSTFTATKGNANQFGLASGQQSGSRWGIKGTQSLGGGTTVNFVFENAVNVTSGQSTGFTRQSTLGLVDNRWGAIDLGRRISPGTQAFAGIDPFDFGFGQASMTSSSGATFVRLSNLVAYASPNVLGFNVYAGWSFDTALRQVGPNRAVETFGTSNKFRALSLAARYSNADLLLAGMFDTFYAPAKTGLPAVKQWNLGATYDLKVMKLHLNYGQSIDGRVNGPGVFGAADESGGDTNTSGAVLYRPGSRTNQWMMGLTVPTGANSKVFASVQQQRPGGNYDAGIRETQTTASVGYTHNLSPRTNVYAFYSYMRSPEMYVGAQSQGMGVGVRHAF